jgi:16S rRNA (adenine1518-N6/adenine1519-N6)-dimethyltransferase
VARRKLGQHFLASSKILERIARAACGEHVDLTVEIGPGRGALTEHLLKHSDRVIGIELDSELAEHLRERLQPATALSQRPGDNRLEVIEADALDVNWSGWGRGVLAGNLPYYAATAIVSRYVRTPGVLRHAVFLIQKEVAERITAQPSTRDYGYFSVECQLLARAEYLFTVPPGAFQPPPKVDSAVIRLTPQTLPEALKIGDFLKFASVCFRKKRKTLRNNLAESYSREWIDSFPGMGRRAEELTVLEFLDLYLALAPGGLPNPQSTLRA